MGFVFGVCLIGYLAFLFVMSIFIGAKEKKASGFLIGGRSVPLFLIVGTTVATLIGTGSSVGAVGYGYFNGFAGALYGIGGGIGVFLLAMLFGDVRKYNFLTMTEEFGFYYGNNRYLKGMVSILVYLASIGWMGAHMIGGSAYISYITGMSPTLAKVIVALGFSLISIVGGYLAVVWTDTIQAIVLFIGFILMLVFSISLAGGLQTIISNFPKAGTSFLGLAKVGVIPGISLAINIAVGVLATPSYRQRIYSASSVEVSKKSFYVSGIFYFIFSLIPAITGMAAWHLNPDLKSGNLVFPFLAMTALPTAIGIIALIAGTSATISSASSDAMVSVSIFMKDIYTAFTGKILKSDKLVVVSKLVLAFSTLIALLFTLVADNIITYITTMISTIMSGLFVAALLGRFWKRVTPMGGIFTIIGGSITSLIVVNVPAYLAFWGNPIMPSLIFACIAGVIVSLLTKKSPLGEEEVLAQIAQDRSEFDK